MFAGFTGMPLLKNKDFYVKHVIKIAKKFYSIPGKNLQIREVFELPGDLWDNLNFLGTFPGYKYPGEIKFYLINVPLHAFCLILRILGLFSTLFALIIKTRLVG